MSMGDKGKKIRKGNSRKNLVADVRRGRPGGHGNTKTSVQTRVRD